MSAGNLAFIACVPGLGLMLLAVEASQKKSKGPGSDFIRMIESMGITPSSSNCESSEWGCSSTSKQPTLQHDHHMGRDGEHRGCAQCPGRHGQALCTFTSAVLGHHRPQNTASASTKVLAAAAGLPCHATGKPCAISQAAGPGPSRVLGACSVSGVKRGDGPCITCQTTGQACPGALTRTWAHLGQHWEPAGHRNRSGRALCGSAQHSRHCRLPTTRSVISGRH